MLSANGFEGMLTKISTKRIQEKSFAAGDGRDASDSVVLRLNVRHVDATNSANRFVESLQKELNALNVKSAFALPISWKSVAFEFPSPLALLLTVFLFQGVCLVKDAVNQWRDAIDQRNFSPLLQCQPLAFLHTEIRHRQLLLQLVFLLTHFLVAVITNAASAVTQIEQQ